MVLHLMLRNRTGGERLGHALLAALEQVGQCEQCRMLTEERLCPLCASPERDRGLLCVVENPADLIAIEQAAGYRGLYFVLMGRLSPLDGIGPTELGLDKLAARLDQGDIREVILATSPTLEGMATADAISMLASSRGIVASRIAFGVPVGSELEFSDSGTLRHAFAGRAALRKDTSS
jgi:recombination protein RecR